MNQNPLSQKVLATALTYDDVLLVPQYSEVLPNQTCLKTQLTKANQNGCKINLNLPIMSAAMDTVTESAMAIAMAQAGGVGVIHKNLDINKQVHEVFLTKNHETDLQKFPNANLDANKKLIVGAAIATGDINLVRCKKLVEVQVDFFVLDSAHAHSIKILEYLKTIKSHFPNIPVVVGNIATAQAAHDLINAGADAIKVGIGPGSICTTRIVTGVGVPQLTALSNVLEVCNTYEVPVIADGGIKYSGDIVKALALGANAVMLGNMLSGTEESPGTVIEVAGQKMKTYVGMGSLVAMQRGSSERYFQEQTKKFVPEGIEALVEYKGSVHHILYQISGGIRSGMGYLGAANLTALKANAQFVRITNSALKESHPHSLPKPFATTNYK